MMEFLSEKDKNLCFVDVTKAHNYKKMRVFARNSGKFAGKWWNILLKLKALRVLPKFCRNESVNLIVPFAVNFPRLKALK